jgi:hypothetical protein
MYLRKMNDKKLVRNQESLLRVFLSKERSVCTYIMASRRIKRYDSMS